MLLAGGALEQHYSGRQHYSEHYSNRHYSDSALNSLPHYSDSALNRQHYTHYSQHYSDSALNSLPPFRLRPPLARLRVASQERFDPVEKGAVAKWTADPFCAAQRVRQRFILARAQQRGEIRDSLQNRRGIGNPVGPRRIEQGMNARPWPVLGPLGQPRPHRVERDITQGRKQMRLIHRNATEPPLPEMPGPLLARVDPPGIAAMHLGKRAAQRIGMFGNQNQVDMVGHQHPAPHRHPMRSAMKAKEIAICGIVVCTEERLLPPVAALGDMVGNARENKAGEAGHVARLAWQSEDVN